MKRTDEGEKTADKLKALIEKGINRKVIRPYDHLMGAIELQRNNFSHAIEYLERAEQSLPFGRSEKDILILDALALAYFRADDLEKAREKYAKITTLTTSRLDSGDIYTKAFYRLGQIYEKQGNRV